MKNFSRRMILSVAAMMLAFLAQTSGATAVTCGNIGLGNRTVTIDPGLVGGLCYAQNGNFTGDDFSVVGLLGLYVIDKDVVPADPADDPLQYTQTTTSSGTWSFAQALWGTNDRLFLAFHFGGGGNTPNDNPDSFVVELAAIDAAGTYALGGGQLNGLSNIYLLGVRCEQEPCHLLEVPEPGSLALFALAMVVMGYSLHRRRVRPSRR